MLSHSYLSITPSFETHQLCFLQEISAREGVSILFNYQLVIACANHELISGAVIGTAINFSIHQLINNEQIVNHYSGLIEKIHSLDYQDYNFSGNDIRLKRYRITVVPELALLKKTKHSRVYQKKNQTLSDIIETLLNHYGIMFDNHIKSSPSKNYCIQYNESDYDFIMRLLTEAGACFYFEFTETSHKLILSNAAPDYPDSNILLSHKSDTVTNYTLSACRFYQQIVRDKFSAKNFDPKQPNNPLYSHQNVESSQNNKEKLIYYYYPSTSVNKDDSNLCHLGLLANEHSQACGFEADSHYILKANHLYKLTGPYFDNYSFDKTLIGSATWQCEDSFHFRKEQKTTFQSSSQILAYSNTAIPLPEQNEKKERELGVHIATVVNAKGATGEEQPFYHDAYGYLCVKFSWEEHADNTLLTNHFDQPLIPVMHQWDNGIHRVGTKVIIGFINNNVDTPIILGTFNHAAHLPIGPFDTSNMMTSLIKRQSGADDDSNYNYMRFNDKQNDESMDIFAGKDFAITINQGDQTTALNEGSRYLTIQKGSDSIIIDKGDQTLLISTGDQSITLAKGDQSITIKQGDQRIIIDGGKRHITVGSDESHQNNKNYTHTVSKNYTINVDGNVDVNASKNMTLSGKAINIKGAKVTIEGTTKIDLKSININFN